MHINNNHWVTSARVGSEVYLYDSKFRGGDLSSSITNQLAVLYKSAVVVDDSFRNLVVNIPNIQQQRGYSDCGLFAIANAVRLAFKEDFARLYDQSKMRKHLEKCFRLKNLTPFPVSDNVHVCKEQSYFPVRQIEIFCICGMPETYGDIVECGICYDWYHQECVSYTKSNEGSEWSCTACRSQTKSST
jgi:hypothetical protein